MRVEGPRQGLWRDGWRCIYPEIILPQILRFPGDSFADQAAMLRPSRLDGQAFQRAYMSDQQLFSMNDSGDIMDMSESLMSAYVATGFKRD